MAQQHNRPWCQDTEIARTIGVHLDKYKDGIQYKESSTGLPTLGTALSTRLKHYRDNVAEPMILSRMSNIEKEMLTRCHEYITHPILGNVDGNTSFQLSFKGTDGTLLFYENPNFRWENRNRDAADTGYSLTEATGVINGSTAAPTKGMRVIVEYDYTMDETLAATAFGRVHDTLKGWSMILSGYHFLLGDVITGDEPNVIPEGLQALHMEVDTILKQIEASGDELSLPELQALDQYQEREDDKKSRMVELLRR